MYQQEQLQQQQERQERERPERQYFKPKNNRAMMSIQLPPPPHLNNINGSQTYHVSSPHGVQLISVPLHQSVQSPVPLQFDQNYAQRMLPKQMLLGSPFYQSGESYISSPVSEKFRHNASRSSNSRSQYYNQSHNYTSNHNLPYTHNQNHNYNNNQNGYDITPSNNKISKNLQSKLIQVSDSGSEISNSESILENDTDENLEIDENNEENEISNKNVISSAEIEIESKPDNSSNGEVSSPLNSISKEIVQPISTRSIQFINLTSNIQLKEILDLIEFGPIENCHFDLIDDSTTELRSVTISFIDVFTANKCYQHLLEILEEMKHILNCNELEIIPAISSPLSNIIKSAIQNDGATRAVCLANIPFDISKKQILAEVSKFGILESLKYFAQKNAAFANFTSISSSVKCVEQLPLQNSILSNCKIFYSNDRNSDFYANNNNHINNSNNIAINDNNELENDDDDLYLNNNETTDSFEIIKQQQHDLYSNSSTSFSSPQISNQIFYKSANSQNKPNPPFLYSSGSQSLTKLNSNTRTTRSSVSSHSLEFTNSNNLFDYGSLNSTLNLVDSIPTNIGNRTIYLGNLASDTTVEDICNNIRGGILQSVKILHDKKVAFVTFIYANDAAQFMARTDLHRIYVRSRCLKVGWGRHPGPLSDDILEAVKNGATRNLYIGILEENEDEYDIEHIIINDDNDNDNQCDEEVTDIESEIENDLENSSKKVKTIYHCIPDENILRRDFSVFGSIEQINFFKNGRCAFINFSNIVDCIKAVNEFNGSQSKVINESFDNKYSRLNIYYGKDRCGNPSKKRKQKNNNKKKKINDLYLNSDIKLSNNNLSIDGETAMKVMPAFEELGISSKTVETKAKEHSESQNSTPLLDDQDSDAEIEIITNSGSNDDSVPVDPSFVESQTDGDNGEKQSLDTESSKNSSHTGYNDKFHGNKSYPNYHKKDKNFKKYPKSSFISGNYNDGYSYNYHRKNYQNDYPKYVMNQQAQFFGAPQYIASAPSTPSRPGFFNQHQQPAGYYSYIPQHPYQIQPAYYSSPAAYYHPAAIPNVCLSTPHPKSRVASSDAINESNGYSDGKSSTYKKKD